jgi:hypothetical protein
MTSASLATFCLVLAACSASTDDGGSPDAMTGTGQLDSGPGRADAARPPGGCGPSTCDGCCDGDVCVSGNAPTACGAAGADCAVCGPDYLCQEATCRVDRASRWDVIADSGDVFEDNAGGGSWDVAGGLPDPYVRMETSDGIDDFSGSTDNQGNTLTPVWDQLVLDSVPAAALLDDGILTTLMDDDGVGDDSMGSCNIVLDDGDFDEELLVVDCPFSPPTRGWTLRFHLRRD